MGSHPRTERWKELRDISSKSSAIVSIGDKNVFTFGRISIAKADAHLSIEEVRET